MTMANPTTEINAFLEASQKAFTPFIKFSELSARTVERLARHQYEVAGDALNYGLANLQASTQSKDVPGYMQKAMELANQFVEKQTQRQQELVRLANEYHNEFTQWFDKTAAELPAKAVKLTTVRA
jgi:phasin family protein